MKKEDLECSKCKKKYIRLANLQNHERNVHCLATCEICNEKVAISQLKLHRESHVELYFRCFYCGSIYKDRERAKVHCKTLHGDVGGLQYLTKQNGVFKHYDEDRRSCNDFQKRSLFLSQPSFVPVPAKPMAKALATPVVAQAIPLVRVVDTVSQTIADVLKEAMKNPNEKVFNKTNPYGREEDSFEIVEQEIIEHEMVDDIEEESSSDSYWNRKKFCSSQPSKEIERKIDENFIRKIFAEEFQKVRKDGGAIFNDKTAVVSPNMPKLQNESAPNNGRKVFQQQNAQVSTKENKKAEDSNGFFAYRINLKTHLGSFFVCPKCSRIMFTFWCAMDHTKNHATGTESSNGDGFCTCFQCTSLYVRQSQKFV